MGYWLGVTRNCGDALTYYIYVRETHQVIARSVIRPVIPSEEYHPNLRVSRSPELHDFLNENAEEREDDVSIFTMNSTLSSSANEKVWSRISMLLGQTKPSISSHSCMDTTGLPIAEEDLIPSSIDDTLLILQNALTNTTPVFELPPSLTDPIAVSTLVTPSNVSSLDSSTSSSTLSSDDGSTSSNEAVYDDTIDTDPDLLSYNVMVDQWKHQDSTSLQCPTSNLWAFSKILKYRKKGPSSEVLVDWVIGSPKWESINYMKSIDLMAMVEYAKKHRLSNKRGWKWVKQIDRNCKRILKYFHTFVNATPTSSKKRKWHFGYQIPTLVEDAFRLDKENGNSLRTV